MKRILLSALAIAVVSAFAVAAYSTGSTRAAAVNEKCPVAGKDVNPEKTSEITIKFCCNNCKGKFEKDPVACLSKLDKLPTDTCPVANKPAKDASATVTVAFCCGECKGKFDKEPGTYLKKLEAKKEKK
jgi:YHS domain-containing protein